MHATKRLLAILILTLPFAAQGAVKTETVEYRDGDTTLSGYLAYDDAMDGQRPGIIVAHQWWGLDAYIRERAEMLAELGYVAFAVDMYGDRKVTEHANEAKGWMTQITENIDAWQKRALLGLDVLKKHELVDPSYTAAIGYCFGGATVMQMAYAGADLDGVVSFHGPLPPANEEQQKKINTSILVAHGEADSFVPADRLAAFKEGLEKSGADWQMVTYGGARHAFTDPAADRRGNENLKYDEKADQRSWALMQSFFEEIFAD